MSSKSIDCVNCDRLNGIVSEQKKNIQIIESRINDMIRAYKAVSKERDALLASSSSLPSKIISSAMSDHHQQTRLSALETRVAELSSICGKYECERLTDKNTIEMLMSKCDHLTYQLETNRCDIKNHDDDTSKLSGDGHERPKRVRHRAVQTDYIDNGKVFTDDINSDRVNDTEDNAIKCDVSTQTEYKYESDDKEIESAYNKVSKKNDLKELAIVTPTQRSESLDSDEFSDTNQSPVISPSPLEAPSPTVKPFPVITSVRSRNNSESLLASGTSHSGVSLFYANELARKEIDLAESRIQTREYECALRELNWKYNVEKFKLQSRITELEKHQTQMASQHPSNQLNMTYIRNVLLRLLNTKDRQQRQFMINALLTALDAKYSIQKE